MRVLSSVLTRVKLWRAATRISLDRSRQVKNHHKGHSAEAKICINKIIEISQSSSSKYQWKNQKLSLDQELLEEVHKLLATHSKTTTISRHLSLEPSAEVAHQPKISKEISNLLKGEEEHSLAEVVQ